MCTLFLKYLHLYNIEIRRTIFLKIYFIHNKIFKFGKLNKNDLWILKNISKFLLIDNLFILLLSRAYMKNQY